MSGLEIKRTATSQPGIFVYELFDEQGGYPVATVFSGVSDATAISQFKEMLDVLEELIVFHSNNHQIPAMLWVKAGTVVNAANWDDGYE